MTRTNLYIGISVTDPNRTTAEDSSIYFDNTDSGFVAAGDNEVEFDGNTFLDQSATGTPDFAVVPDAHVDGSALQSLRDSAGTWHIIYVVPLCGSDPTQDFCINLPAYGQDSVRLGFTIVYNGSSYPADPANVAGYGNFIFQAPTTPPPPPPPSPPPVPTITLANGDGPEYLAQAGSAYSSIYNFNRQARSPSLFRLTTAGTRLFPLVSVPALPGNGSRDCESGLGLGSPDALSERYFFSGGRTPAGKSQRDVDRFEQPNERPAPDRLPAGSVPPGGGYSCQPIAC